MLHKLRDYVHPVIAITWYEAGLMDEMRAEGFEVHVIPVSTKDNLYGNIRSKIDFWFDSKDYQYQAKKVQRKYLDQYTPLRVRLRKKMREKYNVAKLILPGVRQKLFETEERLLANHTNFKEMVELVEYLNVDAVFTVTPFQWQEDILLRACKAAGKKMIASILSFDNITKRGWIPVSYHHYMVWNKFNHEEAIKIYKDANSNNVTIVGAAQFDFYFDHTNLIGENEWRVKSGLPCDARKIILYAGGPRSLFPNEPQYLKHIVEAITSAAIHGNPIVLFRCHPIDDVNRWKAYVGQHPNLFYDESWTGTESIYNANISKEDIEKLCSTLAYTDVHINLCSTMTVDGCAYSKPQIGPAYDDVNPEKAHLLKGLYSQKHFQPIIDTGGLCLADSKGEMTHFINEALEQPQNFTQKSKEILEEIITFSDGKSTDRVVNVLKQILD